jgi:KaiC/GvpD/RAD55 family RecA-like ATPase
LVRKTCYYFELEEYLLSPLLLPILGDLIPGEIDYGCNLLIEFEPRSIWYETSLTIVAKAVRNGIRTEYHTFQHLPAEVRKALGRFGLEVQQLEEDNKLRIADSYSTQTGLGAPEQPKMPWTASMKVSDWSIIDAKMIKASIAQMDKRWLHIDDDTSVLLHYNQEKEFLDYWRTRNIPLARAHETVMLHSVLTGTASESFYRKFESLCDGIIEFKSEEKSGQLEQYVRVSVMRGKTCDTRWRSIRLKDDGEVTFAG